MKRKLIEDSIRYLKYLQENKKINIDVSQIKETDIILPENCKDDNEEIILKGEPVVKESEVKESEVISTNLEEWKNSISITELDNKINNCVKCNLHITRKNFVYGSGSDRSRVMCIGEAPGNDEDIQGKPFVGRAGKLLTDILAAINFSREDVYICNILKCRPPDNRNPLPEEIEKCKPYLLKQIELLNPKFILCLGTYSGQVMTGTKDTLGRMRGKFYEFTYKNVKAKLMVTYHPAALLRNPNWKKPTWEDVQLFRKEYDKKN